MTAYVAVFRSGRPLFYLGGTFKLHPTQAVLVDGFVGLLEQELAGVLEPGDYVAWDYKERTH